ncbi:hypothetical protein MKEN_01295200 [Mycena kentingensis (nom. inval.)]|nr:hypothetical protein MKEN_01295200 [Mycena kentingensis (nom. inval.)]
MFAFLALASLIVGASAKVHDVQVGGDDGKFVFVPEALSGAIGDQVVFHFNPKNHSVVQSAFDNPCGPKEGGARSEFFPVAANSSVDSRPTFTVTIDNLDPQWFYCAQAARTPASHCGADDGAPNSFANFKKAALAIGASLSADAAAASATPTQDAQPSLTGANGAAVTLPPVVDATLVTVPITMDSTSTWTTTYTSFLNSPAATPVAAEGAVHTVVVGGTGPKLLFDPDHILANPRDQVVFQFQVKNHSVVQSAFSSPCSPLNANNASAPQALRSGFRPVGANDTDFPTWTVTVNDTAPLWFYCEQTAHCGSGMIFAINAVDNTTRNFAAFKALAQQLNGTGTSASAAPSGSAAGDAGAASTIRPTGAAGVVLALVAIAASLL